MVSPTGGRSSSVIADLTGNALEGALAGGLDILKLSHDELAELAKEPLDSVHRLTAEMARLERRGARNVVISRADQPALASLDGSLFELRGPRFEPLDRHGAGDSMVAALAVGIARGLPLLDALRLSVRPALGARNRSNHGQASAAAHDATRPRPPYRPAMGLVASSKRQDRFLAGSYHTDGLRLLRIVCEAGGGAQRAVEDCKTMDIMLVPLRELDLLDLRPVAK